MTAIDPTARISDGAVIGQDVVVGPYCVIGPNVSIGDGCRLLGQVHIAGHTSIGPRTRIQPFASLGSPPQSVHYHGEPTRLIVGADCDIREGVTMNIGTPGGRGVTTVGDRCFLMANSHVGHDCEVGDDVTMANNCLLGGHVSVGNGVFFGGHSAVHQFSRVGEGAMVAGLAGIGADVIPFGLAHGRVAKLMGINVVGLKRRGATRADLHRVRAAYRALFLGDGPFRDRFEMVSKEAAGDALIEKMIAFIRVGGRRPLMQAVADGTLPVEPDGSA